MSLIFQLKAIFANFLFTIAKKSPKQNFMKRLKILFIIALVPFIFQACNTGGSYYSESSSNDYVMEELQMMAPTEAKAAEVDKSEPNSGGEGYDEIIENEFLSTKEKPLSTFSIDVDRASYSNIRRFIQQQNQLPPKNAVRIEEMINYFEYDYPQPTDAHPLSINTEFAACPWNPNNRLALVGLQGKLVSTENVPPMNLVFLIDVSGSMSDDIALMKEAFQLLVEKMRPEDRISIVTYAGATGVVLSPTTGEHKDKIKKAIRKLESGGSTGGSAGINLAYKLAKKHYVENGNNRVILATDGDFNVGISSDEGLVRLIEQRRDEGVFLSVLGFGMGNYQDSKMEKLADNGNGNYAYIDNLQEAKKVFVTEMSGTLYTIAKDVKLQLEFDPTYVASYRLVGYENRLLRDEDFDNDQIDAGDMGAGHTVTAIYEIVPVSNTTKKDLIDIKFRYKQPDASTSQLLQITATDQGNSWENASNNLRFSASVASFGMVLRDSKFKGSADYSKVKNWAQAAKGSDLNGYRGEMITLVEAAEMISQRQ